MKTDSWKRPIPVKDSDVGYTQQPKPHVNNYLEATPEEVEAWQNGGDYFMTGKFDPMKLFVVVPAVVQIVVFFMMLGVMAFNELIF